MTDGRQRAAALPCWSGEVMPRPLDGGITNLNYLVEDAGRKYVVRIGGDIPLHQVMRFNELAASRAAHAAGISPEVVFAGEGALVLQFIEGQTLKAEDVASDQMLGRILPVLKRCHMDMPKHLRGPVLTFWVFHVLRDYAATIREGQGRLADQLAPLMTKADLLETAVGPIDLVLGHNDLLPANFIDDGEKVWLIDWDYAGFNSPLFDLGGLASNNGLSEDQEEWMLEAYFERSVDDSLRHRYAAMKCASLLRETLWSMVSEIHSDIDFDYAAYTNDNLRNFQEAYAAFSAM